MRSPIYEAGAYGVVPAQFTVGAVYAVGLLEAVPVSPLVALLVLAHVAAPVVFVTVRSAAERNLDTMDDQYRAPMGGGENPDPELQVGDLGGAGVSASSTPLKRRLFLYSGSTLVFSVVGVVALYAT